MPKGDYTSFKSQQQNDEAIPFMREPPGYLLKERLGCTYIAETFRAIREHDQHPVLIRFLTSEYPTPEVIAHFAYEF